MTPAEWESICTEVASLWGPSVKWRTAKEAVWKYARNVDAATAHATVEGYFLNDNTHPPSPSEIISKARAAGGVVAMTGPCPHRNVAVFTYHDDGTGETGMCSACKVGFKWHPGKIRTVGDWEKRAKEAAETDVY